MKYLLLILALSGVLIEATFLSLPLGLIFLIILGAQNELGVFSLLAVAFMIGTVVDIWLLRPFGLTAALYTAVIALELLYRRKMETHRLRYLIPYTVVIVGIYSRYFFGEWAWQAIAAVLTIAFVRVIARAPRWVRGRAGRGRGEYDRLGVNH